MPPLKLFLECAHSVKEEYGYNGKVQFQDSKDSLILHLCNSVLRMNQLHDADKIKDAHRRQDAVNSLVSLPCRACSIQLTKPRLITLLFKILAIAYEEYHR